MLLETFLLQPWPWAPPPPPPKTMAFLDQWRETAWAAGWVGFLLALLFTRMPARAAHFFQVYCEAWEGFSTQTVGVTYGTAEVGGESGSTTHRIGQKQPLSPIAGERRGTS